MAKKDENDEKADLLVFGYACKLFRDDERAVLIDKETHLIPWMGDESLKIDRYDGRGALYDLASHESKPGSWDQLSTEEIEIEQRCDDERYRSLLMNEVEEITYQEEHVKRLQQEYGQIAYDYDSQLGIDSADLQETPSKPFVPPPEMVLPPDLIVPQTMKHSAIIERTALFIAQQGSQMEILMKLKQQGNKNFDFLSHNDPLHEFYKHILSLIKSGSYVPTSQEHVLDENAVDVSTEDDFEGHYLHPSLVTKLNPQNAPPPPTTDPSTEKAAQPLVNEPPELTQKVIEKMVDYVIRNGPAFERAIMRKEDERFSFICSTDKYYSAYRSIFMKKQKIHNEELAQKLQKQKAAEEKIQQSMEEIDSKTLKKRPLPVNFSIKKPKESKGLDVPSALPVEESSDEEEGASPKQSSSGQGTSAKTEAPLAETSNNPDYVNPLTKRLKRSTESAKKPKHRKDAVLQSERKMKVAKFLKDLKKKS